MVTYVHMDLGQLPVRLSAGVCKLHSVLMCFGALARARKHIPDRLNPHNPMPFKQAAVPCLHTAALMSSPPFPLYSLAFSMLGTTAASAC